jgi:hypothetical protein
MRLTRWRLCQAVAAAGAAAYATTRNDDVGQMARATGKHALNAVEAAKGAHASRCSHAQTICMPVLTVFVFACLLACAEFDKTHDISGRAAAAARAVASKVRRSQAFKRVTSHLLPGADAPLLRCCAQAVEVEKQYDLTNKAKASAQNAMNAVRRSGRCKALSPQFCDSVRCTPKGARAGGEAPGVRQGWRRAGARPGPPLCHAGCAVVDAHHYTQLPCLARADALTRGVVRVRARADNKPPGAAAPASGARGFFAPTTLPSVPR